MRHCKKCGAVSDEYEVIRSGYCIACWRLIRAKIDMETCKRSDFPSTRGNWQHRTKMLGHDWHPDDFKR